MYKMMYKIQRLLVSFTLIELLIVIAVISILIGIALPRFRGMQVEGNIAKAKGELRTLQTAIESYYIHHNNTYPVTGSSALQTALANATPNIIDYVPTDPFSGSGADYEYVLGGTNDKYWVAYSVGPGGTGSATISNDAVSETNGTDCIYVSNTGRDSQP